MHTHARGEKKINQEPQEPDLTKTIVFPAYSLMVKCKKTLCVFIFIPAALDCSLGKRQSPSLEERFIYVLL